MNSLERRLQLGLALSLVVLMGILWVVGNRSIHGLTEDFVVSRLEHDAESLLAALDLDSNHTRVRKNRISQIYHQPLSGHYYIIRLDDGREFNSRSLWDHTLTIPKLASGESRRMHTAGPSGQSLLIWAEGFQKRGQTITLAVAEDLNPIMGHRDQFKRNLALLALGGMLGLLLVQRMVVRRSFRRLEPVQKDIRRLAQGETGELSEDVPSEIMPLVQEFNHLLQLLEQRLERSRNALGNLTHVLKGPLHLLIQYFDNEDNLQDDRRRDEARIQAERIRQLMERELKRARLAGKGVPSQRFNPHKEIPYLVEVLQQIHQERSVEIHCQIATDVPAFGDREDMLELLGNLLDNAFKWATSKVSCAISLNNGIEIIIADDGSGLSSVDMDLLTQRGVRLDEMTEGHGLGLAITKDIVKLYGGVMDLERSPSLGGLQIRIVLPH
ncbi:MAG: sensor histidine kinase [Gammaproteobacteria bacterium]|nr:sensor histidine kinase [Gammaproteobacteria bacterium]